LEGTYQRIIALKTKQEEALMSRLRQNPRVKTDEKGNLKYFPIYSLRDKDGFKTLLEKHYREGKGAVLMSELKESMPNPEKMVQGVPDVIEIPTGVSFTGCARWPSHSMTAH
jgi:hypothetical protein